MRASDSNYLIDESRTLSLGGCGGIKKFPSEVPQTIYSCAANVVLLKVGVLAKGLAYGNNFDAPSILNTIQYQPLWGTFSNCSHLRTHGQEILYKCVTFSRRSNLELFARTISQNQNIGDLVRSLPISVPLFG